MYQSQPAWGLGVSEWERVGVEEEVNFRYGAQIIES